MSSKISMEHVNRIACIYVRQSTTGQVLHCKESQRLQYNLINRAKELGWEEKAIRVIDNDLGSSASGCIERKGFKELLSCVCDGKIGAIFSVEASRLARNGREWHTLLEICGIMQTLLIDNESTYDLNFSNDRLLLGLKGEMSAMELSLLRERSQAALQAKARRGELYLTIPAGYVKTADNQIKKDPNKRVQGAIGLVFIKFREYGSASQVLDWFVKEQVELPVISNGAGERRIRWKIPCATTPLNILKNPIYGGAYAYGRTVTKVEFKDGHKRLKKAVRKEQKDWDVLITDHHESYISWEEYQSNQEIIQNNSNPKRPIVLGSVRGGEALLGGLLRCGHCGRKLYVRYHGRNGSCKSYTCSNRRDSKGNKERCFSFGGYRVDKGVTDIVLNVLSPMGIDGSIKALEQLEQKTEQVVGQRKLSLEQARYEASRLRRQYDAVDPENRLVASSLEKEWNSALGKVSLLENEIMQLQGKEKLLLSSKDKAEIMDIGSRLSSVWHHPCSSLELKKRIIRTMIQEIIVYVQGEKIRLIIHWTGGDHTKLEVQKNKFGETSRKTDIETKKIITELARIMPDKDIASFLGRLKRRTCTGLTWNRERIRAFRNDHGISIYRKGERKERGEFTVHEASLKLGIGETKVWRLIQNKILPAKQVCSGAPWIINGVDLGDEKIIKAAHCKLPKRITSTNEQQDFFKFF